MTQRRGQLTADEDTRSGKEWTPESASAEREPHTTTKLMEIADFDPQALMQVIAGAHLEHRLLPGGGSSIDLLQCRLPHSVVNRGRYAPAVLANGTMASKAVTIGMMLDQKDATIANGFDLRVGALQFYAENSELFYRASQDATWFTFVVTRERLHDFCVNDLDEMPRLPASGSAYIEAKSVEQGDRLLAHLRDLGNSLPSLGSLRNAARLGESIETDLLARMATFMSTKPLMRKAGDRQRLRMCREILQDTMEVVDRDPEEILDLQSMSKATGLSPRTLQRTFQAEYGLCPQEWLRVERLHRVRDDLLSNPDCESVTHTATRWGFFHLSRFSQYYREIFAERPSETLARRATPGEVVWAS